MCVYRSTTETLSRKVVFTSRCLLNFLPGKKTAMTANMEILPSLPSLPLSAKWSFSTSISTALTGDALKSSLARKKRGRAPCDLGDHRRNDPEHWESDSRMENRSGYFLFESGGGEMMRCLRYATTKAQIGISTGGAAAVSAAASRTSCTFMIWSRHRRLLNYRHCWNHTPYLVPIWIK